MSDSRGFVRFGLLAALWMAGPAARSAEIDASLDVYARPQQLVRLPDGRRVNLLCQGSGTPLVIFEAGAGGSTIDWRAVQGAVSRTTRTCAYDRAGMGFSDPGPTPRSVDAVVQDFVALTRAARLAPPYVLVAHSLGSYFVRLYADRYRASVAGMVLIDPSVEHQETRMIEVSPPYAELLRSDQTLARKCLRQAKAHTLEASTALFRDCTYGYQRDPAFSTALYAVQIQRRLSVAFRCTLLSETEQMDGPDSRMLEAERRSYGNLPLIVLTQSPESSDAYPGMTAAQVSGMNALWLKMHDELAGLSTRGSNRVVEHSGHYIQRDRPEVVVDAVAEVIAAARSTRG